MMTGGLLCVPLWLLPIFKCLATTSIDVLAICSFSLCEPDVEMPSGQVCVL